MLPAEIGQDLSFLLIRELLFIFSLFAVFCSYQILRVKTTRPKRLKSDRAQAGLSYVVFGVFLPVLSFLIPFYLSEYLPGYVWVATQHIIYLEGLAVCLIFAMIWLRKRLIQGAEDYIPACAQCETSLTEGKTDAFFREFGPNEQIEIKAGSYVLEVWDCLACRASEKFKIKIKGFSKCPKCRLRTLSRLATVVKQATSTAMGQIKIHIECRSPSCAYEKTSFRSYSRKSYSRRKR